MSWTIWPKGCKKCNGDLTPERDCYGSYIRCMQCGTIIEDRAESVSQTRVNTKEKVLIAA